LGKKLIVKVSEIPEEGLFFEIRRERETLKWGREEISFDGPIRGWITIKLMGEKLMVEGEVQAVLLLTCSRCLEEFPYEIKTAFKDEYLPLRILEEEEDEVRLSKAQLEISFYQDEIDIEDFYMEKLYLALPMKPLCDPECKGLCPICGVNMNYTLCKCASQIKDPRWEPLALLKEKLLKH